MSELGWMGAVTVALCALCFGALYGCESAQCGAKSRKMDLPSTFSLMEGCMVKTKAGWRPIGALREIDP